MSKEECLTELTTLLCNFGLTHYELLKRFFMETLIRNKLGTTRIKQNTTYGTIVKSFELLPNFDIKMREMLDNDLRNALAHDTWYFTENHLMYKNLKNELVQIPFARIPQKINTIIEVYSVITSSYWRDFERDAVRAYNIIGSKKINKIFPLYGMDKN